MFTKDQCSDPKRFSCGWLAGWSGAPTPLHHPVGCLVRLLVCWLVVLWIRRWRIRGWQPTSNTLDRWRGWRISGKDCCIRQGPICHVKAGSYLSGVGSPYLSSAGLSYLSDVGPCRSFSETNALELELAAAPRCSRARPHSPSHALGHKKGHKDIIGPQGNYNSKDSPNNTPDLP